MTGRSWNSILFWLAGLASLAVWLACTPAAGAVTAGEPLPGGSPLTPAQLEAELALRNPNHIHPDIALLYVYWGNRYGIRSDLAFAQMLHETDSLRYGGLVQPWQNNFAGIGATGPGHPGSSYPDASSGVRAHIDLLWQYVNYRGCRTLGDLNGRWAVPGYGYGEAIARYATEMRMFSPAGNWMGNFNEITGSPVDGPAGGTGTTILFPWYDSTAGSGMAGNWILISNQGSGDAAVAVYIGGERMRDPQNPAKDFFTVAEGGRVTPVFPATMGGPVKVVSLSGQPLLASQRVIYHDSFSEVTGVPAERLRDAYEFSWYDSKPAHGMAGNWILVSNQGSQPAEVGIWIGGAQVAAYTTSAGNAIAPGASVTPVFPETMGGPIEVRSTNHQPLVVSQRVLYKESFSEVTGYPADRLDTEYYFTWYDSLRQDGMYGDWVLVANRGGQPAEVNVFVGGILVASYSAATGNAIPPGGIVTPQFGGVMNGPVYVHSLNGQPLIASQRVLYRDSFEEVQGVPPAAAASEQLFTWYDSTASSRMSGDWILVANEGSGDATVEIWVGGAKMHDPANPGNDFFTVPEGGRVTPLFSNLMGGPVRVVSASSQPLLVSQRVLYGYAQLLVGR